MGFVYVLWKQLTNIEHGDKDCWLMLILRVGHEIKFNTWI